MEALVVAVILLLSSTLVASQWCVCRQDAPQASLQKTIDYACGAGADCNAIHETGQCYNPNNVPAHCSWAANSYYQNNKGATCDFTGTATLTTSDPSSSGCSYPTSASAVGTTTTPTTGGTMGGTPGTFTPGAGTGATTGTGMGTTTGTTGTGFGGGLGPTGTSTGMDTATAGLLPRAGLAAFLAVLLSAIAFA